MEVDDTIRIVRGRTAVSKNLLHRGFRYGKDGKPSTLTNKQAWRCNVRSCTGRLHTVNGELVALTQKHNHGPDLADCEVKATLSAMKDLATTTRTANHLIYASSTGNLAQATRVQMPNPAACKKQAQRGLALLQPFHFSLCRSQTSITALVQGGDTWHLSWSN
jgi:hypothetical protein